VATASGKPLRGNRSEDVQMPGAGGNPNMGVCQESARQQAGDLNDHIGRLVCRKRQLFLPAQTPQRAKNGRIESAPPLMGPRSAISVASTANRGGGVGKQTPPQDCRPASSSAMISGANHGRRPTASTLSLRRQAPRRNTVRRAQEAGLLFPRWPAQLSLCSVMCHRERVNRQTREEF